MPRANVVPHGIGILNPIAKHRFEMLKRHVQEISQIGFGSVGKILIEKKKKPE